jgi:iron complex transport system substrate-binding protein
VGTSFLRAFLTLLVLLHGCDAGAPPAEEAGAVRIGQTDTTTIRLTDDTGRELIFPRPPRRIVSLIPSVSQIFQALGAGEALVGRTVFDTTPPLAHLPSVGEGLHPNLEALVALRPELVIRFAGESDPETPLRLDALGIPHLALRPDGVQDVREIITSLGTLAGREASADSLLREMDATLSEIRRRVGDRPPRRVAYLLGGSPPWVAGPRSYIQELIEMAGGTNVFSDLQGLYGPVSVETLMVRDLELILTPDGADLEIPGMGIPVHRVSPSLEIPGPRLAADAWALGRILHPEAFR